MTSAIRLAACFAVLSYPALAQVAYTFDSNRILSLSYNGQSYWGSATPTSTVVFSYFDGVSVVVSRTAATSTASYFEHTYEGGGQSFTVRYTPDKSDTNGMFEISATVTNTSGSGTITRLVLWPLRLTLPSAATNTISATYTISKEKDPYRFLAASPYNVVVANGTMNENATIYWNGISNQINFDILMESRIPQNGPEDYMLPLGPGQSATMKLRYYFSTEAEDVATIPLSSYLNGIMPVRSNWADRRPVMRFFLADYGNRGTNNPRGYFRSRPTFNVWDSAAFRAQWVNDFTATVAYMNALTVRPQGLLLWDVEGQEFAHAFTYVGSPDRMEYTSPEMLVETNGIALVDELVGMVKNAGYSVGFTIRPQRAIYSASTPATCSTSYNGGGSPDIYVNTTNCPAGSWPCSTRTYRCDSTNVYGSANQNGFGYQTDLYNVDEAIEQMRDKIRYAMTRWGATFFYIDTTGWTDASEFSNNIWVQMQQEFPTVMLIPENNRRQTVVWTSVYDQSDQGVTATYSDIRNIWPFGTFGNITTANRWSQPGAEEAFKFGWSRGDLPMHNGGLATLNEVETINEWFLELCNLPFSMTDTSNNSAKVFQANARCSFTYPLVARVYFASDPSGLSASTTFCDSREKVRCYSSGSQQLTASLNLSSLPYYQIRYYDFAGNLVSNTGSYGTVQ